MHVFLQWISRYVGQLSKIRWTRPSKGYIRGKVDTIDLKILTIVKYTSVWKKKFHLPVYFADTES